MFHQNRIANVHQGAMTEDDETVKKDETQLCLSQRFTNAVEYARVIHTERRIRGSLGTQEARDEIASRGSSDGSAGWLRTGEKVAGRGLSSAICQPLPRVRGTGCRADRCQVALESTGRFE